ncbi:sulfatase [Fulvivirga sp. M361]|nr:sulfatase [Fulvivirga sp. M361]
MDKCIVLIIIVAFGFSCQSQPEVEEQKKPNVLFIAVDDLRPMLGVYGDLNIKTPNIDRLASMGTMFEKAYCNVPVCGASRASLLTGLRPTRRRFLDYDTWAEKDAPGVTSLPAHFKKNGYFTASLGKIFHFADDMAKESWSVDPWRASYVRSNGKKSISRHYLLPENQQLDARGNGLRGPSYEQVNVPDSAYFDGQIAKRAIKKLNEFSQADTSFFLAVGFHKPHLPFNAPKKYWDMYPEEAISLAQNSFWPQDAPLEGWYGTGELRKYHGVPSEGPVPDSLAMKLVRGYKACVSYVDAQVGELLQTLESTGLDKNTIIVLWGDHGYLLGEHKLWCKHITFEKALHVPLLINAPGYQPGQRTQQLAEYVDLYPTLCDLAGLDQPEHLEGTSLVSLLNNPEGTGKEFITSRYLNMEAIKTDKFLYTEWIDSAGNVENRMLYDHTKDPDENVNVAEQNQYEKIVYELSQKLAKSIDDADTDSLTGND